jgi:hypothetical protein
MDYQVNSPPASCGALAPILLLLAACLLILSAFAFLRGLKEKRQTAEPSLTLDR